MEESHHHVNCVFRQKVKKIQSKELVSKLLISAASDRFDMKKSRMESILGFNIAEAND